MMASAKTAAIQNRRKICRIKNKLNFSFIITVFFWCVLHMVQAFRFCYLKFKQGRKVLHTKGNSLL
jgi:hypothetical protein